MAVRWGVSNLFEAGRHDLVVPLVNALGKRTFKSDRLKDVAIQRAFYEGAERGNQDIVELYCEHPAITSEEYADGLHESWNNGKPNQVFPFLLEQADQGDLDVAKKKYAYRDYAKFRQAIDKAFKTAPPAGSRHLRPLKRAKFVKVMLGGPEFFGKWETGPLIVALYLVDEEVWNKEMGRLKPAQPPRKEPLPTKTIPPNPVPKKRIRKKAVESSSKSVVDKPPKMKDIIKQRQREEEERRNKKIFDDMQKKRDAEKRAEDDKRRQTIKSWEKEVEDVNDGVPCTPSNPKGNGGKTPKGQQKKKRPPVNRSKARNGNGQGRAKSRGKSKKGSTSFPLSKPSQRASMRVPLPTAEPGRRGTLVGDDAAAELLQKFEPADQERYELYANLHGYEAAIEQMQRDLETPPTRPDSGASPSTESASLSSRSRESGDGTSGPGHPVPQACASRRRKVKGVKIHIDELALIDLDSVAPKSQKRPPHDDSSDGLLALAMSQSIEEHQQ